MGPEGERVIARLCWLTAATAQECHAAAVAWSLKASRRTRRLSEAASGGQMMRKQNCSGRVHVTAPSATAAHGPCQHSKNATTSHSSTPLGRTGPRVAFCGRYTERDDMWLQ